MEAVIKQFNTWLMANSKEPNTVNNYVYDMKQFIMATNINSHTEITKEIVLNYFANLKLTQSQSTINRKLAALKSFLDCFDILMKLPKGKRPLKKVHSSISEEELETKIEPVLQYICENGIRAKAIIYTLYYCGLRRCDIVTLKRSQFNFEKNIITAYIKKQNIEKEIDIPLKLKDVLVKYFASEGEDTNAFNTSISSIQNIFTKLKVNFPEMKLHPHKMRRSYATNLSKLGMRVEEIQGFMGHKELETTAGYICVDEKLAREKYLRLMKEKLDNERKENLKKNKKRKDV